MTGHVVSSEETSPSLAAIVASVDTTLPSFRDRTSPDGMMTIVFTDIVGSTDTLERLGELPWLDLMRVHSRLVRDCVADHAGEIVKFQGDGCMIVFASATAALRCAVELQRTLARHSRKHPAEPLPIRIGIHTGNIYRTDEDFLGRAVVLAARITGHAQAGEILVSAAARRYTAGRELWRYARSADLTLKGLISVERVHSLIW